MVAIALQTTKQGFTYRLWDKGHDIGYVNACPEKRGIYRIRMVFVTDSKRGRGYGTMLIKACMDNPSIHTLILNCKTSLLPFYKQLGFTIVKQNKDGYALLWNNIY